MKRLIVCENYNLCMCNLRTKEIKSTVMVHYVFFFKTFIQNNRASGVTHGTWKSLPSIITIKKKEENRMNVFTVDCSLGPSRFHPEDPVITSTMPYKVGLYTLGKFLKYGSNSFYCIMNI